MHLRISATTVLLTGLIITISFFAPTRALAETITLAADDWCPYTCDPKSDRPGFMIEIARIVFAKHGYKVRYKFLPWARAVEETRLGYSDAIVGAMRDEVPGFVLPSMETGHSRDSFFSRGGLIQYTGPTSLKGHSVGTAIGYSYGAITNKILSSPHINVIPQSGNMPVRKNITKLIMGRLDLVLGDEIVVQDILRSMNMDDLIFPVGSPEPGEDIYIAFSPANDKSKLYADILSKGVKQLRKSGELQKILRKYGVMDWRQP